MKKLVKFLAVLLIIAVAFLAGTIFTSTRSGGNISLALSKFKPLHATGRDTTLVFDIPADYSDIDVSGTFNVRYTDSVDVITVTADACLAPYIQVFTEGNDLKLKLKPVSLSSIGRISALVPESSTGLKSIDLSGASAFSASSPVEAYSLDIEVSGASKADLDVNVTKLDLEVSGASKAQIGGNARTAEIDCSGASKISDAVRFLTADDAEVELSGASKCHVCAGSIRGEVSGASKLFAKEGAVTTVTTSGASKVEKF